jgi:hypothetical protein
LSSLPELLGASSRAAALVLLVAAPLAFGSVHREAYPVFLATAAFSGLASLARAAWCRRHGQALPRVPGARLLLALNLLVLIQATPLPAAAVRVLSPTSFSYYQTVFRLAPEAWRPISVNASLTWLGLFFLCALSLLYAGVFREFGHERRARALAGTIVVVATLMTLVGFVQKVSADPNRIYGIWKPPLAAHVFGPYPNRSHYAGYVVMAIPLALGLAVEALFLTRRLWSRRARGFTALGEPEGSAAALRLMLVLFNVAGVLAAGSRTAVLACALSTTSTLAAFGRRVFGPALAVAAIAGAGLALVDVDWFVRNVNLQRLESDRLVVWRDMLRIVPDFPALGVGWNALGDAYAWRYQTVYKWGRWDEAHNEYLQVLLVTGVCGAAILLGLLWLLLRAALRAATQGPFGVGLFGACVANAITNLSDFNLQVPANAATFAAIAGLVIAYRHVPAETSGGDVSESGGRNPND